MLGMTPAKQGNWETVGKGKADERKKRGGDADAKGAKANGTPAQSGKPGGKGKATGINAPSPSASVFAEFDRVFAAKAARDKEAAGKAAAATAAAAPPAPVRYGGGFASLAVEDPPAPAKPAADSNAGQASAAANGKAGGKGAGKKAAAPAAPKAPKAPKKPRVGVAQAAAGVDVAVVQELIAGLQQRYAGSESSQVEVLADNLAKLFKEAQVDLPKALATKPLSSCVGIPYDEVPAPLANAVASFCSSVSEAALAEVGVALLAALTDGLPTELGAAPAQPPRQQAGLLIMLATMLRTRPGAVVLAAPQLLSLGRALTAPARLPLLLWTLSQAAAAEPAAAVAAWVRVVLPQCTGAPLPAPAPKSGAAAPGPQIARMDAASQEAAVAFLESLLKRIGGGGSSGADVALGGGRLEPVVPGAAVEALARAAAPPAPDAAPAPSGKGGKGSHAGAPSLAAAEALAARLHAPLLTLAGARQQGEWLVLALETAALSQASSFEASDAVTDRAAASVAACLASPSGEGAFEVWESKHKGHLRGSTRVLCTLARRPELLRPVLTSRARTDALRRLLVALPARHKSFLVAGKGWQGSAARASESALATLRRRASGGWAGAFGGKGSKGAAGGPGGKAGDGGAGAAAALLAVGALTAALAAAGVAVVASAHRQEAAVIVSRYAGPEAAAALDASVLAPLQEALGPAMARASEALGPAIEDLQRKLGPAAEDLRKRAAPLAARAAEAAAPLVARASEALQPLAARAAEAAGALAAQAQDIYTRAVQQS